MIIEQVGPKGLTCDFPTLGQPLSTGISIAETVSSDFLTTLRRSVALHNPKLAHLPPFLRGCTIQCAHVKSTGYLIIRCSALRSAADRFELLDPINSDAEFFWPGRARPIRGVVFELRSPFLIIDSYSDSEGNDSRSPIFRLPSDFALTDAHLRNGGASLALMDIQLRFPEEGPVRHVTTIDAGLILAPDHRNDQMLGEICARMAHAISCPQPQRHDDGADLSNILSVLDNTKRSSCVVLGKDTAPELEQLRALREDLKYRGFDAVLMKDTPEIGEFSLIDKVRTLCHAATFTVALDDQAAGHLVELTALRDTSCIVAVLRARGHGSTWMLSESPDRPNLKVFEFENSPHSILDDVVNWATERARSLGAYYDAQYPWRRGATGLLKGRKLPLFKVVDPEAPEASRRTVAPTGAPRGTRLTDT